MHRCPPLCESECERECQRERENVAVIVEWTDNDNGNTLTW